MKHYLAKKSKPLFFAIGAVIFICVVFVTQSKTVERSARETAPPQKEMRPAKDSTLSIPIKQWLGLKFVILKKPKLFRQFGYELYLSKELAASKAPIDPTVEAEKHRLRYNVFAGKTVVVTGVEPAGNDYLVIFKEEGGGRVLFGKTRKGTIEGIACADDLDKATNKWAGRTIYSRRRFIDTYDSLLGSYGTIQVRIQDKLRVTGVSWGLTPLPPKPIWLSVETATGEKGFIPICMSWTNVLAEKIRPNNPWEEELFEVNPVELYKWDSLTWKAINSHTIASGMNKEQVTLSWGAPHTVTADTSKHRCPEQWLYASQYLCFDHDTVISVGAR